MSGGSGAGDLERFGALALAGVRREYPSQVTHLLLSDEDARPPRELTPAFYGSFDWHSAVHGHWCLARVARLRPGSEAAGRALEALERSFAPERLAGEVAYLSVPERRGFERPYGLAWLLQLCAELREWGSGEAPRWHGALAPLESLAVARLAQWLPSLRRPVRSGEHAQTAFALGLALDWARTAGEAGFALLLERRALEFYGGDVAAPVAYEPGGHDFLSPVLGEADLMRRVLPPPEFARWLEAFLPEPESPGWRGWLEPLESSDRSDGKLAHLDGLALSRAWMLEGTAAGLPPGHPARAPLERAAARHAATGLAAVSGEHYAGAHWLGTFAAYLVTGRGLPAQR